MRKKIAVVAEVVFVLLVMSLVFTLLHPGLVLTKCEGDIKTIKKSFPIRYREIKRFGSKRIMNNLECAEKTDELNALVEKTEKVEEELSKCRSRENWEDRRICSSALEKRIDSVMEKHDDLTNSIKIYSVLERESADKEKKKNTI